MSRTTISPTTPPAAHRIPLAEECGADVARWVLRIMIYLHERCGRHEWSYRDVALAELGLGCLYDPDLDQQFVLDSLKWTEARLRRRPRTSPRQAERNLLRLGRLLELSPVEQTLLRFGVAVQEVLALYEAASMVSPLTTPKLSRVLARILGLKPAEVRWAFRRGGPLAQAGLIRPASGMNRLPDKLNVLDGLSEALLGNHADLFTLFRDYFRVAPAPQLTLADYPHLVDDLAIIRPCVAKAAEGRTPGINLLIHGRPGTGKTEFVRALAADLGLPLYEVSGETKDGECQTEGQRFRAYQLCQQVLAQSRAGLILFDEIEDVFPTGPRWLWAGHTASGTHKAWTNYLLETNPVPTVWLSNAVSQIDPAFLRRFTYSLELRVPPRSVRRRIVEKNVQGLPVSPVWIERAAKQEHLTPAQIAQACRVARAAAVQDTQEAERLLEQVISRSLEVMGLPGQWPVPGADILPPYDLKFLNPSRDLAAVTAGLMQRPRGRLCLYGPPGSGKTAYARHVAEHLDRPLLSKQASDLLSMWVGGTEKLLAEMFREARAEGAVLLLDEADSFLQDRQGAQRSWEITQVNELLVQMEAFQGLFICSTNLMERLDPAVLRRFDLKVRFGYLRADQAWALVRETLAQHGAGELSPEAAETCRRRLAALTTVTPGDVATALRQARLMGQALTPEALLGALEEECRAKLQGRKPVTGFTA